MRSSTLEDEPVGEPIDPSDASGSLGANGSAEDSGSVSGLAAILAVAAGLAVGERASSDTRELTATAPRSFLWWPRWLADEAALATRIVFSSPCGAATPCRACPSSPPQAGLR